MVELIIVIHFLFDWILQPRGVAKIKHKSNSALGYHLLLNVAPYLLIVVYILYYNYGLSWSLFYFFVVNFAAHALIDKYLPKGKTERQMINYTAIDQVLHLGILFFTIRFI